MLFLSSNFNAVCTAVVMRAISMVRSCSIDAVWIAL
jgi:hypothetical protein